MSSPVQHVGILAIGLVTATSAVAAPGDHIQAGDATVTPRLSLGFEHSTNAYRTETPGPGAGATNAKFAPGLDIRLVKEEVDFGLTGTYELRKYFASEDAKLDRYDDFAITADLDALKKSVVGLRFREGIGLRNNPVDSENPDGALTSQLRNDVSGAVVVRPGDAFELALGGRYAIDRYHVAGNNPATGSRYYDTKHTYGPTAALSWKFFPRTAIAVDFAYDKSYFTEPIAGSGEDTVPLPDHDMLRVTGGMRGRVTDKLIVTLMGGYGSAVYDEASVGGLPDAAVDLNGLERLLIDTAVRYELSPDDRVIVGFTKDFRDSWFTNYVSFGKLYLIGDARFTERVGVNGEFNMRFEGFRGATTRDDRVLAAKGAASFYVQDWASLSAGAGWTQRSSSTDNVEYDEIQIGVYANFTY